jgi:AraC family transcriptional activator of pobA
MKKVPVLNIHQFHEHDSAEDFYANTLQNHLVTRHKDISHPHSHNFYLAILFTSGSGSHEVDFTSYTVQPGALFFLNPGQTHNWQLSPDTTGYIFFHTRDFYELHYTHNRLAQFPFYYSMHNTPCVYLKGSDVTEITRLFKNIYDENHTDNLLKTNSIISLTDVLYNYAMRLFVQQNPDGTLVENAYYNKFRKLEELVEQRFKEEKSPAAYAALMAITPRHLNRITQAVTGKTATDVILDRVLLEAKKQLVHRHDSFANIAHALGYEDYAYFSRLFKNKTGETPSGFLARYRH